MRYPIITLCGSTKFRNDFLEVARKLQKNKNIVIMPCDFTHYHNNELSDENMNEYRNMHKQKIDMADSIYVINKNGYIGESTKEEIEYARQHNKKIEYLEPV